MNNMKQVNIGDVIYRDSYDDWLPIVGEHGGTMPRINYLPDGITWRNPKYDMGENREIWADGIRWCKSLNGTADDPVSPYGGNKQYGVWGYLRPALMDFFVDSNIDGKSSDEYFFRPSSPGYGRDSGGYLTWWGGTTRYADLTDTVPMISDYVYRSTAFPSKCVSAHNGGDAKRGRWRRPAGTNSGWLDGHVEWNDFDVWPVDRWDFQAIRKTSAYPKEGYAWQYIGLYYAFWTRRGKGGPLR
jgi:prepilin-type processing-associated H-X9-DG protein